MTASVELRPVTGLVPYKRNARVHGEAQVDQIAASIREFGWTNPLLIDGDGGIIAGHGRLLAAHKLGLTEVPCIVLDHLSEVQKRALIVADNQIPLNATWDNALFSMELADIQAIDANLISIVGFDIQNLPSFGNSSGEAYSPALQPTTARLEVTDIQVAEKSEKMDGHFQERAKQTLLEIACPHCSQVIIMNRDAL